MACSVSLSRSFWMVVLPPGVLDPPLWGDLQSCRECTPLHPLAIDTDLKKGQGPGQMSAVLQVENGPFTTTF